MNVSDYMTTKVVTANLRDGLHQTFHRMLERNVRHMPVLGAKGELAGIISERDIRRPNFVDDDPNTVHYYVLDNNVKVNEAMTANPATVVPTDSIQHALDIFIAHKFGALPVVDANGKLIAILSALDLLKAFRDSLVKE